jgi:hypothetical protein
MVMSVMATLFRWAGGGACGALSLTHRPGGSAKVSTRCPVAIHNTKTRFFRFTLVIF